MYVAENARFRIQGKLRFRYRLLIRKRPAHLLPVARLCTKWRRPVR